MIRILSTKTLPADFHLHAAKKGVSISELPVIETRDEKHIDDAIAAFRDNEHLVFTSAVAVNSLLSRLGEAEVQGKTIYLIGDRSSVKFPHADLIKGMNAAELADLILKEAPKTVAYFKGNKSLDTIKNKLNSQGIKVLEHVVYHTKLLYPAKVKDTYHYVWFFSPSGVESFSRFNALGEIGLSVAIGETTASVLPKNDCLISPQPKLESLLETSLNHYQSYVSI